MATPRCNFCGTNASAVPAVALVRNELTGRRFNTCAKHLAEAQATWAACTVVRRYDEGGE